MSTERLNFKRISIDDKILIENFLNPYNYKTHEFCFTNLYIWREHSDIQYSIIFDTLIIKKKHLYDLDYYFLQPINYQKEKLTEIIEILKKNTPADCSYLFKDAEEAFIEDIKQIFPAALIEYDMDNSDYIYDTLDFINLKGQKFQNKRNHINQFKKLYNYNIKKITSNTADDCIKLLENSGIYKIKDDVTAAECAAICDLLENIDKLDFCGLIVYIDNNPAGFIIAEKLNENMAVYHIEKADIKYKGIYNFLKQQCAAEFFSNVKYINLEQDLGILGLRTAKLEYRPVKLEPKFKIKL